jgi:hypothetical protein
MRSRCIGMQPIKIHTRDRCQEVRAGCGRNAASHVSSSRSSNGTIVAQRVNNIEQSPTEFLHATEESAIDLEEKVRDVVAHRACRVPPVGSCRRHLRSIANRVIISFPLVGNALDLLWDTSARRDTTAASRRQSGAIDRVLDSRACLRHRLGHRRSTCR